MISKTCLKRPLKKKTKIGFQHQLSLDAGQKEHSAILSTFIKLQFVIKIFILSIFEWPLKTGFTVICIAKARYVIDRHMCHMAAKFGVFVGEDHGKLVTKTS